MNYIIITLIPFRLFFNKVYKLLNKKYAVHVTVSIILFSIIILIISLFIPIKKDDLTHRLGFSYEIYDRNGILIRKGLSINGYYYSKINLKDIPDYTIKSLIQIEDKRFFSHFGIDFKALIRALWNNFFGKTGSSGGSTITMQVARNMYNLRRNIFSKFYEIWLSLRLENSFSKEEILELYFNTVSFGKQIIGIEKAARIYFDKKVSDLSIAQSAFLISSAKYPMHVFNNKLVKNIYTRQKFILNKLKNLGILNNDSYTRSISEQIIVNNIENSFLAPHFTDFVLSYIKSNYSNKLNKIAKIFTTLDLKLQEKAYFTAMNAVKKLKHKNLTNASVIIFDNATSDLLAMVGSIDYFKDLESGQVNGAIAIRSPGSALKPFTYATGIENRIITPATIIPDVKTYIHSSDGAYIPVNDNQAYHGPITARKALACSYNIPAARVIAETSTTAVLDKLKQSGFISLKGDAQKYGAALTLGGADITLYELSAAYNMLANNGIYRKPRFIMKILDTNGNEIVLKEESETRRVFSEQTSFLITNILSDNRAREDAFGRFSYLNLPFFCASKTGTSKGFRNNWTVGYSKTYTVGVWVGNFDNSPMQGMTGITSAGGIFRTIILNLEEDYDYKPKIPKGIVSRIVCPKSGKLNKPECDASITEFFIEGSEPIEICDSHYLVPFHKNTGDVAFIKINEKLNNPNIEFKKVLILPDVYNRWLEENGFTLVKNEIKNYVNWIKGKFDTSNIPAKIIFPLNGSIFAIDPIFDRNYQTINFRVSLPPNTSNVEWYLNNKKISTSNYPFNLKWQIERGEFDIYIIAKTRENKIIKSNRINFIVK